MQVEEMRYYSNMTQPLIFPAKAVSKTIMLTLQIFVELCQISNI